MQDLTQVSPYWGCRQRYTQLEFHQAPREAHLDVAQESVYNWLFQNLKYDERCFEAGTWFSCTKYKLWSIS
jgi:hypothetical protein